MKPFTDYNRHYYFLRINRVLQVLIAAAVIVLITPTKSSFKYEFQQGHYWKHETLESPFDFAILKTEKEIAQEKNEIIANKTLYFDYNNTANTKMEEDLDKNISSYIDKHNLKESEKRQLLYSTDQILQTIIHRGIISDYTDMKNYDNNIIVVNNNVAQEHEIAEF